MKKKYLSLFFLATIQNGEENFFWGGWRAIDAFKVTFLQNHPNLNRVKPISYLV